MTTMAAPLATTKGAGPVGCCGNHRVRCLFGHPHTWTTWYENGILMRTEDTFYCADCGGVCTGDESPSLVDLARDLHNAARLVVIHQYNEYLAGGRWLAYVEHGDLLWQVGCAHAHKSEDVAVKCARGTVRRGWVRRRAATNIVTPSAGVVEWQWVTRTTEYARCAPVAAPYGATIVYLGRVAA